MKRIFGFTLIEIMISIAIVSILAVIAVYLYSDQIRRARRSDGTSTLAAMSNAQERYRLSNASYGSLSQVWGGVTSTSEGYYTLSITGTSSTGYTLTATAVGDQANDSQDGTACNVLQLSVSAGTITKSPTACW